MGSLDFDSLFTNIPPDKAMDIYIDNLRNGSENSPNIPKHHFLICLT